MEFKLETNEESRRTIGDNLRNILEERNMKASKLAKQTGLDASYIYDIIKNERTNPSVKVVIKIAKSLGVNIIYLINGVDFD